ncbi:hypothetical protein NN561_016171 [Cricetulus griseus]
MQQLRAIIYVLKSTENDMICTVVISIDLQAYYEKMKNTDMTLLPLLLLLAAALPPSLLHNYLDFVIESLDDLSTARDSIREEIVNKHNELRKMVSPPASDLLMMQWSNDAQENAQKWASQCTFQHSPREDRKIKNLACGENLFMSDYLTSWSSAVQQWYDEVHSFDFGSGPTSSSAVVGHYTQQIVVDIKMIILTVEI